jgi:hypothetical protein
MGARFVKKCQLADGLSLVESDSVPPLNLPSKREPGGK